MQEDFAEIRDLEVFDASELPEYDVEQIAQNFNDARDEDGAGIHPPLVIGHSEDQSILKDSGLPAAGWIDSLKAVGTKLVADVSQVPRLVADAIDRKAYRRVSAELYTDYPGLGQVLRRVALLGGAIPEIKTLQDVVAVYSDDQPFTTVSTVVNDVEPEPEDDDDARPTGGADREQIERFCEDLRRSGNYAPAWDDLGLPEFLAHLDAARPVCFAEDTPEQTPLAWFQRFLKELPPVVSFNEKAAVPNNAETLDKDQTVAFYRGHRDEFESLGVTLDMFLAAETNA